ncbi:MAG: ATP-dependent helicase [Thermoproteota archaeon]|nr:MAG: ATP-dependent helicase [Candidatus Korarchaeota archaeon]
MAVKGAFRLLRPEIVAWLESCRILEPTPVQEKCIPIILRGVNVLVTSPTGTGKTEAAVLPIASKMLDDRDNRPIALYVTPLRALNRDVFSRLQALFRRIGLEISVRHGDTPESIRRRQAAKMPDMLITTPETLQIMLGGRKLREGLSRVKFVVVDEVHQLAFNKRGAQLSAGLERLRELSGGFQVVGLSATIGSLDEAAKVLFGSRSYQVVDMGSVKKFEARVVMISGLGDREVCGAIDEACRGARSALVFTNTRATAEYIASAMGRYSSGSGVHHSSLSREMRVAAEEGLKSGGLRLLVCTSSLELGIDIGTVDVVVQYMSPRQVTRFLQRVGRSGHKPTSVSRGVVLATSWEDALEASVIIRRAKLGELDAEEAPRSPLDVLCHQLAGLIIERGSMPLEEALRVLRRSYLFRELDEGILVKVLSYMAERWPSLAVLRDGVAKKPFDASTLYKYYFECVSMIPDIRTFEAIDEEGRKIGVLDEPFVLEYCREGSKIVVGGATWHVIGVRGGRVVLKRVSEEGGVVPSWIGEDLPVSLEIAVEVGSLRERAKEAAEIGAEAEVAAELMEMYPFCDPRAFRELFSCVKWAIKEGMPVPSPGRVVVEETSEFTVVHSCFGTRVNRTLGDALRGKLRELGVDVRAVVDPYRVYVMPAVPCESVAGMLDEMNLSGVEDMVLKQPDLPAFRRRLVNVAKRFGAIDRKVSAVDLPPIRLFDMFYGTPVFDEALSEVMRLDYDLSGVRRVLGGIKSGRIEAACFVCSDGSPFARVGIWRLS